MFEIVKEMMEFDFIQRAALVGVLVSLCSALLGVSLVLKRYAMIGDGLSHVGFGILSIAAALGFTTPLYIAVSGVMVAAIVLLKIGENSKIKGDSAIAIISSTALALGLAVTSFTTGLNTDTCNFMFGSILTVSKEDVFLSVVISIIIAILFLIFYRKLFAITFDEEFSKATGLNVKLYTNLIAILTAVLIVVGMRMMGTMLISSIIIFPALTSMRLFKSFKKVVISSALIGVVSFLIGLYLSYAYDIVASAIVVLVNLVFFVIFNILDKIVND